MRNGKRYPLDYEKDEIIEVITENYHKLDNDMLSSGEKDKCLAQIQIGQLHLNSLEAIENNTKLSKIINNNKRTSRATLFLSMLMIVLAIVSLFKAISPEKKIYLHEARRMEQLCDSIDHHILQENGKIDSIIALINQKTK